jgi:hypothetical protein
LQKEKSGWLLRVTDDNSLRIRKPFKEPLQRLPADRVIDKPAIIKPLAKSNETGPQPA